MKLIALIFAVLVLLAISAATFIVAFVLLLPYFLVESQLTGFLLYVPLGLALLVGWLSAWAYFRPSTFRALPWWRIGLTAVVGGALAVGGAFLWSAVNPYIVIGRAEAVAQSAPYCLQIRASTFEYKAATHWTELSGFSLQTPFEDMGGSESPQWTFHAVLVVDGPQGRTLWNWSYMSQDFRPIAAESERMLPLSVTCAPSADFASLLT